MADRALDEVDVAHRNMKTITANATRAFTTSLMVGEKERGRGNLAMTTTTTTTTIRLALLLCDQPHHAIKAVHGDYGQIFTQLLSDALVDAETTFVLDTFDVVEGTYPPEDVHHDGLLISGSRLSFSIHSVSTLDLSLQMPPPTKMSSGSTRSSHTPVASSPKNPP